MLQQTRVETVVPYFERFLARFPDVEALAAADEAQVLAAWSGLGYYRRARGLRAAARILVARHAGRFPGRREEARALPGVGPYTAGAVLSIAYGRSEALVDGNVARVLARLFVLDEPVDSGPGRARVWELARALVPRETRVRERGPGAWNQALMELGARVCTPRAPDCAHCPLGALCAARAQSRVAELPHGAPARATLSVRLETLLVERRGALLLVRRPEAGRMAGLWELPTRELAPHRGLWPARYAVVGLQGRAELGHVTHAITHHRIRVLVRAGRLRSGSTPAGAGWFSRRRWAALPLTGLTRKILARPFACAGTS
jgi:A/G-specific adenine glycosylase